MQIKLKAAQLHTPLFLAGTNLQDKLDTKSRTGMTLIWDRAEKELIVFYNKHVAVVPSSNVASVTPLNIEDVLTEMPKEEKAVKQEPAAPSRKRVGAQVSTPTSHVFAGEKQ